MRLGSFLHFNKQYEFAINCIFKAQIFAKIASNCTFHAKTAASKDGTSKIIIAKSLPNPGGGCVVCKKTHIS